MSSIINFSGRLNNNWDKVYTPYIRKLSVSDMDYIMSFLRLHYYGIPSGMLQKDTVGVKLMRTIWREQYRERTEIDTTKDEHAEYFNNIPKSTQSHEVELIRAETEKRNAFIVSEYKAAIDMIKLTYKNKHTIWHKMIYAKKEIQNMYANGKHEFLVW